MSPTGQQTRGAATIITSDNEYPKSGTLTCHWYSETCYFLTGTGNNYIQDYLCVGRLCQMPALDSPPLFSSPPSLLSSHHLSFLSRLSPLPPPMAYLILLELRAPLLSPPCAGTP